MKKFLFFALIMGVALFSSCDPKKGDAIKVKPSNDFTVLLHEIDAEVAKNYPNYEFFEASANLSDVDSLAQKGVINPQSFNVAYGRLDSVGCLIVNVDSTFNLKFNKLDEPWLEDMFTTPYVPMTLDQAIEFIQNEINLAVTPGMPVVLRHQLWFCEPEPRFFIGSINNLNTVNVYTGEINQPLAEPTEEWLKENEKNFREPIENFVEKDAEEVEEFVEKETAEK